jgi:hypothetical protein
VKIIKRIKNLAQCKKCPKSSESLEFPELLCLHIWRLNMVRISKSRVKPKEIAVFLIHHQNLPEMFLKWLSMELRLVSSPEQNSYEILWLQKVWSFELMRVQLSTFYYETTLTISRSFTTPCSYYRTNLDLCRACFLYNQLILQPDSISSL